MRSRYFAPLLLAPLAVLLGGADGDGCSAKTTGQAATAEQAEQDLRMQQFTRNQPVPTFEWSLERHMLIQLYSARQRATNTFSYVQSDYTGKVLWSCPSMGFPLPYATQLTNPMQVLRNRDFTGGAAGVVSQQEPNGLF